MAARHRIDRGALFCLLLIALVFAPMGLVLVRQAERDGEWPVVGWIALAWSVAAVTASVMTIWRNRI